MAKPPLTEQLTELNSLKYSFPQYEKHIEFSRKILEAIIPIGGLSNFGLNTSIDETLINDLKEKTFSSRKSMNCYLDPSCFDKVAMYEASRKIISYLLSIETSTEGYKLLYDSLESSLISFEEGIKAVLEEDSNWFDDLCDKYSVEASLLLLFFDSPLRPFFEELTRRVEQDFIEVWWESYCPVCGRKSRVARVRNGKRYMTCAYCGCQYLNDMFICPICGNNDPTRQGFISFPGNSSYELNFCEECNQYIKVIYEERMQKKIPGGLEDLLTHELDVFAQSDAIGFTRA